MKILLISTYELGRQPFGLASPAAWLRDIGADVTCLDLAIDSLDARAVREADLIAFYLPMHTATRIAAGVIDKVRLLNPDVHIACYGLYAPLNESYLRGLGVGSILGGEFEAGLVQIAESIRDGETLPALPTISLARQTFITPDRSDLPDLTQYAQLIASDGLAITVGYTEASRGCKYHCSHCPIVPVYGGRFRVVGRDVVMSDIRQQVAMGAEHITFGDPDFFNGIGHAIPIIESLHTEFPDLTYDVTIKVEHLIKHQDLLPILKRTGCLFVTSAVESISEAELVYLDKGHTRDDIVRAIDLFREIGLIFNPTFVTFTPWTTIESYADLLRFIAAHNLIDHVAPIQWAIRLLIPAGSLMLDIPEIRQMVAPFDEASLTYGWTHPDPAVDALHQQVLQIVGQGDERGASRREVFGEVAALVGVVLDGNYSPSTPIPYLSEAWYC